MQMAHRRARSAGKLAELEVERELLSLLRTRLRLRDASLGVREIAAVQPILQSLELTKQDSA